MANKPIEAGVLREFVNAVRDASTGRIKADEYLSGVVTHTDVDGTVWVDVAGGVNDMPVSRATASYSPGDVVSFSIENGVATIAGNATDVPAPASVVRVVERKSAEAYDAASVALDNAQIAHSAAQSAQADATRANNYANSALGQLGVVQDVIGVLDYASKNGTFSQTSDTAVVPGKVYFTYDSTTHDYMPVVTPAADPHAAGYYELTYSNDSMGDFIMSHLAVTARGLWVLPNGIGSSTTPASGETQDDSDARQGSGYKMLLASDGKYIYDSAGELVRSDTASGTDFAATRDWHVGGEDGYIFYDASEGTITIGGSGVRLGDSRTLTEILGIVEGTLVFDVSESYSQDGSTAILEAHVYRGGVDIVDQYSDMDFAWFQKDESGQSPLVPLPSPYTNGKTVRVSRADAGYGATVVCHFTEPQNAVLLDEGDDTLTTSDNEPLAVRTPSGDYVRVSELAVETTVFDTDKLMVVGASDEHLVTVETLKGVFGTPSYTNITDKPSIEGVTLVGDKTFPDLGIFQTDGQGYDVADDYTLTTMDINALWANAQPVQIGA